jgi:acyl-[acyl-carrier protein] desaturase
MRLMAVAERPARGGTMRLDDDRRRDLDPTLESYFATLLVRHKEATAKTGWAYRDFLPLDAFRAGAVDLPALSPGAYLAVETALLTEVNLPWYTAGLARGLEKSPAPIREFVRVWTSEEDQHATLLESYLLLSGNGDHDARARARKTMLSAGWATGLSPFEGMVYTTIQEAATRTFYLCTARACDEEDPALCAALRRIAKDETLHMAFYRDVVKAHLDLDPDYLRPLADVMLRFEMPWTAAVLGDFEDRRARLAEHGVFRLSDYLEEVVQPLWSYWGLDARTPREEETQQAQRELRRYRAALRKIARRESSDAGRGSAGSTPATCGNAV